MPPFPSFQPGDPVPWFKGGTGHNPAFDFGTAAGRFVVLCFFGSAAHEPARRAVEAVIRRRDLFDDERAAFFGVSVDRRDLEGGGVADMLPGIRFFWDFDLAISRLYGAVGGEGAA